MNTLLYINQLNDTTSIKKDIFKVSMNNFAFADVAVDSELSTNLSAEYIEMSSLSGDDSRWVDRNKKYLQSPSANSSKLPPGLQQSELMGDENNIYQYVKADITNASFNRASTIAFQRISTALLNQVAYNQPKNILTFTIQRYDEQEGYTLHNETSFRIRGNEQGDSGAFAYWLFRPQLDGVYYFVQSTAPQSLLSGFFMYNFQDWEVALANQYTTLVFPHEKTNKVVPKLNLYDLYLIYNRKLSVIYDNTAYDLNYNVQFDGFISNVYSFVSAYIKLPTEIPITPNTIYPVIISDTEFNTTLPLSLCTSVKNNITLGTVDVDTGNVNLSGFQYNIKFKNDHVLQNYKIFKEILFSTEYSNTIPSRLYCNIIYDSTVIHQNVKIGSDEWALLNFQFLANNIIDDIYYSIQYDSVCEDGRICNIHINDTKDFLKFDYKLKYFNVAISEIIQGTSDWNCFIKGSDATTLFTDNKTYRKHIDIYDQSKLVYDSTVVSSETFTVDYTLMGYNAPIEYQITLSNNGQYNKPLDKIYTLVQFLDNEAINFIYKKTYQFEMTYDGTNYSIDKTIKLPFNISNGTITDVIFYDTDAVYIEILKQENLITNVYSYYLDFINNSIQYQGNIQIKGWHTTTPGLQFYPVRLEKDDVIILNKTQIDEIRNNNGELVNTKIYNYNVFKKALQFGSFVEDVFNESICPYNNIYTSFDRKYLFIELNEDYCIHNLNNLNMVSICENNQSYINYNSSANWYTAGNDEFIKYGNNIITCKTIHTDDLIVENNQNIDGTNYESIMVYDAYDTNKWFTDLKAIESEIDFTKSCILLLTINTDYTALTDFNYPTDIIIYKQSGSSFFNFPKVINNLSLEFLNQYYKLKRFIMYGENSKLYRKINYE